MEFCDLGSLEKAIKRGEFQHPETGQPLTVRSSRMLLSTCHRSSSAAARAHQLHAINLAAPQLE